MRIDPNLRAQSAQESNEAASNARGGGAAAATGSELANDTAQLSLDQARVQSLAAQVNNTPEIRQEKVAALGQVVRNGSYEVTPQQTAEAVVSEMLARATAA